MKSKYAKEKPVKKSKVKKTKDKYNSKSKEDETDKIECNRLFTRSAVQNIGKALILDAEDLRTTFWLTRRGFKNIVVPNPFVYDKIKRDARVTAVNDYIGTYINKYNGDRKEQFTTCWLDYCCSFDGNENIKPIEDIKNMFYNRILSHNSTLAMTFCYRKHTRVDYVGQDEDRCRTLVEEQARLNGYNAVQQRTKRYKGMFFIIYKLY